MCGGGAGGVVAGGRWRGAAAHPSRADEAGRSGDALRSCPGARSRVAAVLPLRFRLGRAAAEGSLTGGGLYPEGGGAGEARYP